MKVFLLLFILSSPLALEAKIKALATVPDLAWALKAVGGEEVEVESLLSGHEDPHFVDALPSYIFKLRKADLLCYIGLELELGWLPRVMERSANPKIMGEKPGNCDTSKAISPLAVRHDHVDRSMGDVHTAGNPHYTLSPLRMKEVLAFYELTLSSLAPQKRAYFKDRARKANQQLEELIADSKKSLNQIKNTPLMEYHKEFTYFFHDFALKDSGSVEAIPGVPPSAGEILKVSRKIEQSGVKLILAAPTSNEGVLKKLSSMSGVRYLITPPLLVTKEGFDYPQHIKTLVEKVVKQLE